MMLKLSFLLLAIIHIVVSSTIFNDTKHPNVILLHVNNLNWNDLGIHVNRVDNENSTPNIDRLAYAGIILNHFYSNGGSESLYSGCYKRSSYGNPNLLSTYFERNGYNVNILTSKNYTNAGLFYNTIFNSISNNNEPFLLSVDFGYLGYDIKISVLDDIVGTIVSKLHEREVLKDTIIIFMALPTENAYEMQKSPIESNIRRIAFIYSDLLSIKQSVSNELFHISDILPTLVNAAHLEWRTKDRIFIDGVNHWMALNNNEKVRTSIYGDNFFIDNNWKLCYGTSNSIIYDSINNQNMESATNENYDFNTYVESIIKSDVHELFDDITANKIMLIRHRAKIHCNMNDINESIVINIECSRTQPCLFDLQTDPCEFDDMHENEFDLRRDEMKNIFEQYLNNGIIKDFSNTDEHHPSIPGDHHQTNSSVDDSHVIGDPLSTPSGGLDGFLTLFIALVVFLTLLVIIVCIKERCNSKRSVYLDKSKKVTFSDESGVAANGISSISSTIQKKTNSH
ncbi:uncharacterized protein [Chironomus tepperi]|uniref:uncharacterized protein n=1 Tax=Chironomus tepperi TaxID=113505 RepID=UPI00391FBCC3